jgi:hypothetical protein
MIGHGTENSGNAGLYWINAAETWIDLFTVTGEPTKRGSLWTSETGLLEFMIILG